MENPEWPLAIFEKNSKSTRPKVDPSLAGVVLGWVGMSRAPRGGGAASRPGNVWITTWRGLWQHVDEITSLLGGF